MRAPHFHLKAVLFLSVCLWVCGMVCNGWQGTGYRLRASEPAASQLCKGSWSWSTGGRQHFLPLPTPCVWPACREESHGGSQQRGLKALRQGCSLNNTQGKTHRVSVSLHLLSVAGWMDSIQMIKQAFTTCVLGRKYDRGSSLQPLFLAKLQQCLWTKKLHRTFHGREAG